MDASLRLPAPPRPASKPLLTLGVVCGHGLLLWALVQLGVVQRVVQAAQPLAVRLVSTPEAPRPVERLPEPPRPQPPAAVALVVPAVTIDTPQVASPREAPAVEVVAAPAPPAPSVVAVAPPAPPAPPPAAAPVRVDMSQLRYRVEPPVALPRLSRRLRETGTVVLHVVIDTQGVPRSVTLRQSSGFARLDEQALSAMRQARFVPCTENGRPVECEANAPIAYELEN